jgi:hypothetical protein
MKNLVFTLLAVVAFSLSLTAGNFSINGTWLLTNVKQGNKTQDVYFVLNFAENNILKINQNPIGKWNFNSQKQTISITSNVIKDIEGNYSLKNKNNKQITLSNDKLTIYLTKYDYDKVVSENKKSKLDGTWVISSNKTHTLLTLNIPDAFEIIEKEAIGVTSKVTGNWIFNSKNNSLILTTQNSDYKGLYNIIDKNKSLFTAKHNNKKLTFTKLKQPEITVERLQWEDDDFYTEDGDFKYENDIYKYPFNNSEEIDFTYENISKLIYNYYKLLDNGKTFETKEVTTAINSDSGNTPNIENIFNGEEQDKTQLVKFDEFKYIFPVNCRVFKFNGEEQITVPAGTFNCIVIEGMDNFDEKIKIWMTQDKPGIPIKIIKDLNEEPFGHYYVFELKEIKPKD